MSSQVSEFLANTIVSSVVHDVDKEAIISSIDRSEVVQRFFEDGRSANVANDLFLHPSLNPIFSSSFFAELLL